MLNEEKQLHTEVAIINSTQVRAVGGGDKSGPSPVDRRKKGTKFTLLVDRQGMPLVIHAAPANKSDHNEVLPTVLEFPHIGGQPGRPKECLRKLYADAGYDSEATRSVLRWLGIHPHIRKRGNPHRGHLGRVRRVVERTISWVKGLRRMRVRYDRSKTTIDA